MTRSLVATVGAAALILSIGVGLSQRALQAAFTVRRAGFLRERAILDSTERALEQSLELETGVRGFLLTGDDAFLAPYRNARVALPRQFDELRTLTADDPLLRREIDELATLIAKWHQQVGDPEVAAAVHTPPSPALVAQLQLGRQVMDEIRAAFARFMSDQSIERERQQAQLESTARHAGRLVAALVTIGGLAALALGLLLSLRLRRGVERLINISQRLTRGEFDVPIPDEPEALGPLTASLRLMAASLRERDRHGKALLAVSRISGSDFDALLAEVHEALKPVMDVVLLNLVAVEPTQLRRLALWPAQALPEQVPISRAGTACAAAFERGEPVLVTDVSTDDYPENAWARRLGTPSYVILPLRGPVARVLAIVIKSGASRGAGAMRFLTILGQQLSSAIANTQLTNELETRNSELERASRAKSEFLAMMSHELRTPLNSIIGFSDVMLDGKFGTLGERQLRYVRNINDSGRHLLRLINDLLDMSKIEAGRLEIMRLRCPVRSLVADALAQLQPLADEKRIALHFPNAPDPPPVWADPLRVTQVLLNLLSNAIKFTPQGGRIDVGLELITSRHELRISVRDSGPGIAAEDLTKLFLPFSQLANARNEPRAGTGLGLALVKQLVELMDGHVAVDSAPGQGSRFAIDLRLAPIDGEALTASDVPADAPLVLIVDDDPAARELMQLTLETAHLRSASVATGEAALLKARALQPAVILLDVFLPDRDGWDVLRALRADQKTAHIPVVLVTISNDRLRSFTLGAIDHLVKPIAVETLLTVLARHGFTAQAKEHEVRVLVVDDDPRHCELMRATLEPHGFVVRPALTGEAGLMIAATEPVDLVLLDLVLPDVSGVDVAVALRQDDRTKQVPILLLTANQLAPRDRARLNGSLAAVLVKAETGTGALLVEVRRALGEVP